MLILIVYYSKSVYYIAYGSIVILRTDVVLLYWSVQTGGQGSIFESQIITVCLCVCKRNRLPFFKKKETLTLFVPIIDYYRTV